MINNYLSYILSTNSLINFLLFLIVFYFTYITTFRFFKQRGVAITLGLTTSLIAIFYIKPSELFFIFSAYGLTGAFVLIFAPFLFCLFFIYSSNLVSGMRKLFFIFYGIVTIFLLNDYGNLSPQDTTFITMLIILLLVIIIIFDKFIKNKITFPRKLINKQFNDK